MVWCAVYASGCTLLRVCYCTVNHLFQLKVNSKTPLTLLSWQLLADCWPSCSNHVLSEVAQSVSSEHTAKSLFFPLWFGVWGLVVCCCHSLVFATHCYTNWHVMVCLPRWLMSGWCKVNVPIHDHLSKWCAAIVLHIPWCFIGSKREIFQSLKWGCNLKRKALLSLSWIFSTMHSRTCSSWILCCNGQNLSSPNLHFLGFFIIIWCYAGSSLNFSSTGVLSPDQHQNLAQLISGVLSLI